MKPSLPTKTQVPGHKPSSLPRVDRNRARVFPGVVADIGPGTRARLSLSFLSIAQEGKGLARCVASHSVRRSRVPTSLNKKTLVILINFAIFLGKVSQIFDVTKLTKIQSWEHYYTVARKTTCAVRTSVFQANCPLFNKKLGNCVFLKQFRLILSPNFIL